MSHSRRSNFGRFQSNTASESFQRQLTAPVHKWKKQWVSPKGLAPESSYKICKWVKSHEKAKPAGAISEVGDEETPAPDGDVDVDEEDEGEDGDENMDEDEGEGEEGGEGEAEGEGEEDETKPPTETPAPEGRTEPPTPLETPDTEVAPPSLEPIVSAIAETTVEQTPAPAPATTTDEPTHEAPIPPHTEIPSNAIEITNTTPFHTEAGKADVGSTEPGIEITTRHEEDVVPEAVAEPVKQDEKMDVEEEAQPPATETPIEKDEGLVMGEMEPPVPALAVEGGDVPPSEVEKE
ncbi:hypothetical protein CI109_102354 [Kwoniella shandongensis]|uniref:Uncharacterized protein n=1 Tax=Kwoniella shandongensis TaxID=1734106 RepID=A0A5M6BZW3_9TREE|nr:uncharacterized protein CI109_003328 [Kwoniella shandongensis]KAA5528428.1 hypothetical protein CI109_003328 [Kwoniella shandongensis]